MIASSEFWNSRFPTVNFIQCPKISKLLRWEAELCTEERCCSLARRDKSWITEWTTAALFPLPYLKNLLTQLTGLELYHPDTALHLEIENWDLKLWGFQTFHKGVEIRLCYKLLPSHFFLQYRGEGEGKLYLFYLCLAFPFFLGLQSQITLLAAYVCKVQFAKAWMPSIRSDTWAIVLLIAIYKYCFLHCKMWQSQVTL